MSFTERFFDAKGNQFNIGGRVFVIDIDDETKKYYGTVKSLDPQEGDVDDDGRMVGYGPYVVVDFTAEGEAWEEIFTGHFLEDHYRDYEPGDEYPEIVGIDWEFDEVEVAS